MNDAPDLFAPPEAADPVRRARARQFRMRRLQVLNWGTFDGLHDIEISERGFLFVGRSGSGKSTLLDAIAALTTPPQWLSFNAAAREGERHRHDRNLASYVRGAWGARTDDATGEIATHYLRRRTTFSALALTLTNAEGRSISLIHLYWIRGAGSAPADVRKHYMIAERPFDIGRELADFNLDLRTLKRRLDDVHHFGDTFRPYGERLRHLFGIESEQALKLLHKTQSAKNLGDLNAFLRDFMLDRPKTFEAAEQLVREFAELDAAHREVVTARRQIECLRPARKEHERHQKLTSSIAFHRELEDSARPFATALYRRLLDEEIQRLETDGMKLAGKIESAEERLASEQRHLDTLQARHRDQGGARIEMLEQELAQAETARNERVSRRARFESACRALGWPAPDSPESFGERIAQARETLESWQAREASDDARRDELRDRRRRLGEALQSMRREIEAMERQPSNIPAHMLDLRDRLAQALGCGPGDLPFVGELIEVRDEAAEWRGAIERVLHGFALSLLVDESRHAALARYVNDHHLNARLVYYRVGDDAPAGAPAPDPDTLPARLRLKETVFTPWLEHELARRFDYACVDNLRDFTRRDIRRKGALTRQGQVRHGSRRHEKDDRHRIDDRSRWVLGFDNREKLALYKAEAAKTGAEIAEIERRLAELDTARKAAREAVTHLSAIVNTGWRDVDVAAAADRVHRIEQELAALRERHADLRRLDEEIRGVRANIREMEQALQAWRDKRAVIQDKLAQRRRQREEADAELADAPTLEDAVRNALAGRFGERIKVDAVETRLNKVQSELSKEIRSLMEQQNQCAARIERCFGAFAREWPQAAADMDATIASAQDFFRLLAKLEHDGLPRHEKRFFDMLKEHSHQNLSRLRQLLVRGRREIHERMEIVNRELEQTDFNRGTFLRIVVKDLNLPVVRDFQKRIGDITRDLYADDRQSAERRFALLRELIDQLSADTAEKRRWRELALDVRRHVEFLGKEIERETGREAETYRSGEGKSGGQREKLATTCLAAALRYQLAGEEPLPEWAPVMLDEAFSKADNEFTEMVMRTFESFGFQMIVATPMKAVMTLEPFIGGACFVDINEEHRSATLPIMWDETTQQLDLPRNTGTTHGENAVA